jgi:8-oxo-dGTP diphosphatase
MAVIFCAAKNNMKRELDVVAALIKKGRKILLCRRHLHDHYGGLWEFPGGAVEKGETFEAAIEREIKEETDLNIKAVRLVGKFYDEDETLIIHIYLYRCDIISGQIAARDCADFGFFPLPDIARLDLAPADKKIYYFLLRKK